MGARLYNSVTALFTSVDPVRGGNTTAYTYPQDPINFTDPSGREKEKALSAAEKKALIDQGEGKKFDQRALRSAKQKLKHNEKIRGERDVKKRNDRARKGKGGGKVIIRGGLRGGGGSTRNLFR